jgi:8-oxo-dGTP pyrophosphatase MutT (NUDIX family)
VPHIHEQIDFAVSPLIVYEGKVLLVNHPKYKLWIQPGGHIELDEDPDQTLMREIAEETGLEVEIIAEKPDLESPGRRSLYRPAFVEIHEANAPHQHVTLFYIAKAKSGDFVKSDEHDELKWFSAEELSDTTYNIPKAVQYYAQEAIKRVGAL